jgi:hypothetical protein
VPEQQFERGKVVEVEHAVECVGAFKACPVLQEHAGAVDTLQRVVERVVERFAVIRISFRVEQHFRQLDIAVLADGAIERRQGVVIVRLAQGSGGQRLPIRWLGSAPAESRNRAPR